MVPLKMYFNEQGRAKLLLATRQGQEAPRTSARPKMKRDWAREKDEAAQGTGIGAYPASRVRCGTSEPPAALASKGNWQGIKA